MMIGRININKIPMAVIKYDGNVKQSGLAIIWGWISAW